MINEIKGDLLTAKGVIVHGCNAQGVMGAGVAKRIKNKWPHVFDKYAEFCDGFADTQMACGYIVPVAVSDTLLVVNAITQNTYGRDCKKYTRYDSVDSAFKKIAEMIHEAIGTRTIINFPLIGCGLGGGHWPVVREIIEHRLPDDKFIKNLYVL